MGGIEQVYCIIDDCIHSFLKTPAGKKKLALYYGKRGPKRRMAVADVVMQTLSAYSTGLAALKHLGTAKNPTRFLEMSSS